MDKTDPRGKIYLINEVSQKVGLSQKRIREYEKSGFIRPMRDPRTNNRLFAETDVKQLLRIKELIHEHGFTLSCLRYFIASAPCWTIFNCGKKESCPAYHCPHTPCYETIKSGAATIEKVCTNCPIYLNRQVERIALLEKS